MPDNQTGAATTLCHPMTTKIIGACELTRLARVVLVTQDAERLALFFEAALGCRRCGMERLAASDVDRAGLDGGAASITLALGNEIIVLLQCDQPGRPYPGDSVSSDVLFQHLAIVVADMDQAYRRLASVHGWHAISTGGPQLLPLSSGGVTAFKFRDPEGHPLELIAFPVANTPRHWRDRPRSDVCLGIDHSAISVSDVASSIAFYEGLALGIASRSLNQGPTQARLDGLVTPIVDIVALAPPHATPHLELLGYRARHRISQQIPGGNDIAATRLVFESRGAAIDRCIIDPDGHRIIVEPPSTPAFST